MCQSVNSRLSTKLYVTDQKVFGPALINQVIQLSLTDRAKLRARLCAKNSLRRLTLAKDYLPTKFQKRNFIRSKDIERYQKIGKLYVSPK